jgi:hypothetical protein
MNGGERDELLIGLKLVYLRDHMPETDIPVLGIIRSVGAVAGDEYGSWELLGLTIDELKGLGDDKLEAVAASIGIEKAAGSFKADVRINGKGVSLKSEHHAPAAIVNHTTRPGWERACKEMSVSIDTLDDILDEYWRLRIAGVIPEDISNSDSDSPFAAHREYMSPILKYFIFRGTGSGPSEHSASLVLDCRLPTDISTWKIYTPGELVTRLWPRLVFSVRGRKGMPENFPYVYDTYTCDSISKWTCFWQGEYRGALHVRIQ